jgi:hypothetical protein
MKRLVLALLICFSLSRPAFADPNYAVIGAIFGATTGLIVGNNVDGISQEVAVPILAITGGIIGNHYQRNRYDYYYNNPYNNPCTHYNQRGYYPSYAPTCNHHHNQANQNCQPYRQYPQKMPPPKQSYPQRISTRQFTAPDPHPGVELIKVTVLNVNGTRTDVPIRRVNSRYIGPQGEVYMSLPPAETLRKKYGL